MKSAPIPPRIKKGNKIYAVWLNGLRDMCLENRVEVGTGLQMRSSILAGTLIALSNNPSEPRTIFPVTLTQTGGSTGTSTAYCSWTYTVKDLATPANVLATAKAPQNSRARIVKAACTAGTIGSAYRDSGGLIVLWDCDEVVTTTAC